MSESSRKLAARKQVRQALGARQRDRIEREKRQADLAVEVVASLASRDHAEARAAAALQDLLTEGLSLAEAADLCGGDVAVKELTRLSRVVTTPPTPRHNRGA